MKLHFMLSGTVPGSKPFGKVWCSHMFGRSFFIKNTVDWVDWNLTQVGIGAGGRVMWQLMFQLTVYHAWRVRNKFAIEGEKLPP